ncbi:zinc-dependent microcin-processing U62/PmbA/TldD [Ameyamaea chiangmaiensis NBRC 103196]|uniref:TldD/PmbA family protein n=1 Tax=Ameyamaea chiangmaiensis TaxID=442969 RepID=A0A850PA61_9PROT|nr:TldD/PmbA family protein [Ameyamaea chiangmaiensis]MBS4073887.1 TldD/PmbA family protein [Ameyamaea chiangmaiensis]NVN41427.1 TldD/PmbA family protein [Ameyamaea chiangmaiensis]GBQ68056.1 zinc-dependent microcin-processing U62/PmbA/TldD [Ameyamaea chiangmaiensis NBRC 103196]
MSNALDLLDSLIARAKASGADAADAIMVAGTASGVQVRNGQTEDLERSETTDIGLRVFIGQRSAIASTTTLDPARFDALVEQAIAMARVVPEDRFAGLCDLARPGRFDAAGLDLADSAEPDTAALLERARLAEGAALAIPGVTKSNGGSASYGRTEVTLATSAGFGGHYTRTSHATSATVLAGCGTGMERDYDYDSRVHLSDLRDPAAIGREAGERAVRRLNPTRPRTGTLPVVYDPRVSASLIGHLAGAINGAAIARGTSFLKGRMGQRILPIGVDVIDDPLRVRGLRSRPFDGEGAAMAPLALVEDGILTQWVLDSRSARQLGLTGNARGGRGSSSPPSPALSNVFLSNGSLTPEALMSDIREGIYITEMMGSAVNGITGDYSRGASGFMIRDGALAEPVAGLTVAGNLIDMFARLVPANDLVFRFGSDAPTIRIDDLSIAGS